MIFTENELASAVHRKWGLSIKRKTPTEYSSPCPFCGGRDRFLLWVQGNYLCRQCEASGWIQENTKRSQEDINEWKRQQIEQERLRVEREKSWLDGFQHGYAWKEWHEKMTEKNINWWLSQGIKRHQIDSYELGYLENKRIDVDAGEMVLPAYTIPIRDLMTWDVVNIHYRLADPPEGIGKYRSQPGTQAREFYAGAGQTGSAIVVEGAKKAMCLYEFLDGAVQVVGLPGVTPSPRLIERLRQFPEIFLALDPGCDKQAQRIKGILPQSRIVKLPDKPDDLVISGMSKNQFREYARQSR